jgi:deoxyguanosine kinase
VAKAYEHFFFHYTDSDLLVVDTSKIDFVNRDQDLALLLKRLSEPIRGKQYFLPPEAQESGPSS